MMLVLSLMSTTLFASLALCLGLSACVTDLDDDDVLTGDDLETVAPDPNAALESELTGEPTDPNVVSGEGNNTCGGQPRLKGDGPCLPK